jgi:DNA-binding MarR family transcriptional regulator
MTDERFGVDIMRKAGESSAARPTLGEIGINQFAPYLMNRVASRWNATMAEALKAHDMTTAQMRALAILSLSPSVTINELSLYTVTEQSTMSRTLDALEDQGLVRRQSRAQDMRVRDVSITEQGRAAFARVWPTMHELFQQLFEGVGEEEYRGFIATLHRVLRNVRKYDI